jgi:hypothetical protein
VTLTRNPKSADVRDPVEQQDVFARRQRDGVRVRFQPSDVADDPLARWERIGIDATWVDLADRASGRRALGETMAAIAIAAMTRRRCFTETLLPEGRR